MFYSGRKKMQILSIGILLCFTSLVYQQHVMGQDRSSTYDAGRADADASSLNINWTAAESDHPTLLPPEELEALVGPVALFPDDLLGIILPAATYPLQIVQAARYLEQLETEPGLPVDEEWDNSIVALLNYPEALRLLNEDLDWTWELGTAVLNQQADVMTAIQQFRRQAFAAGNLASDNKQIISNDSDIIEIRPADPEVIYIPRYEPRQVIIYQSYPVYRYYPVGYPVYYYPYRPDYRFRTSFFWGLHTAFYIGWHTRHIHVYPYNYYRHPYYGSSFYFDFYSYNYRQRYHYRNRVVTDRVSRYSTANHRWLPGRTSGARPYRVRNHAPPQYSSENQLRDQRQTANRSDLPVRQQSRQTNRARRDNSDPAFVRDSSRREGTGNARTNQRSRPRAGTATTRDRQTASRSAPPAVESHSVRADRPATRQSRPQSARPDRPQINTATTRNRQAAVRSAPPAVESRSVRADRPATRQSRPKSVRRPARPLANTATTRNRQAVVRSAPPAVESRSARADRPATAASGPRADQRSNAQNNRSRKSEATKHAWSESRFSSRTNHR
jgi:hypothetical protein